MFQFLYLLKASNCSINAHFLEMGYKMSFATDKVSLKLSSFATLIENAKDRTFGIKFASGLVFMLLVWKTLSYYRRPVSQCLYCPALVQANNNHFSVTSSFLVQNPHPFLKQFPILVILSNLSDAKITSFIT